MFSICAEALVRLIFELAKFFLRHWFLCLILIGVGISIKRGVAGNAILGGFTLLSQVVTDIFSIGLIGILIAPLAGLVWAIIAIRSDAPWAVKLPALIPVMIMGTLLEMLPTFGLPTMIFSIIMGMEGVATVTLIVIGAPLILALFNIPGLTDLVCWIANFGMKLF